MPLKLTVRIRIGINNTIVLDNPSSTQRRIGIRHLKPTKLLHNRVDLAQTGVKLVLVVNKRVLTRLTQRPQTVQLLVYILNLRAQQLRLNARLMMLLALMLHFLPLVHNQLYLIAQQPSFRLFNLRQLPQQLMSSFVQNSSRFIKRFVY